MKNHPWKLLLLLSLASGLAGETVSWENADFETGLDHWTVQRGNLSTPAEAAHGGQAGLRIDATENATLNSLPIPIEGGKKYRLQMWIRGLENSHASAMLSFSDGSQKAMDLENADDFKKALPSGKEWKSFVLDFTTPEPALFLNLKLGVWPKKEAAASDTIDIDDVSLTEAPAAP